MRVWAMVQTVCLLLTPTDAQRLAEIASNHSRPLKHIQRARIVLLSAERLRVQNVARRAGVSRPAVLRWQRCYAEASIEGLLRDKRPALTSSPSFSVALIQVPRDMVLLAFVPLGLGRATRSLGNPRQAQ